MKSSALAVLSLFAAATAVEYEVSPDQDFEAECLLKVQPGDSCKLLDGDHLHDGLTRVHGTEDARITIYGESMNACIKGSNTQDRALQVAHDFYTIRDLCFDGEHGNEHVATAIYVLGADKATERSESHGYKSSVTGLQLFDLEIRNFDEECIHFRYFVAFTEMKGCTVQHCGIHSFDEGGGGSVGEAVYVGTALDQTSDGKAPEPKLRSGGADNVDADVCQKNWIHHNTFRTYGNECVDIKEGSTFNLVENNVCENQMDENSGCFGSRGSDNCFRSNDISHCIGAGVRVGGGEGYGSGNHIYDNTIAYCDYGAFNVMHSPQGKVCGNKLSVVDVVTQGSEKGTFDTDVVTGDCLGTEDGSSCEIEEFGTGSYTAPADSSDDNTASDAASSGRSASVSEEEVEEEEEDGDEVETSENSSTEAVPFTEEEDDAEECAGVNCLDEGDTAEIVEIETNSLAGGPGIDGSCGVVNPVVKVLAAHFTERDTSTDLNYLFDGDLETYFSVNKESTALYLELEQEMELSGVSIGFFMKSADEGRIQTFDIAVKGADEGEDYEDMFSRFESSGEMGVMQLFEFTRPVKAQYIKIESHGNNINNWTAFTEIEICGTDLEESNALFGGVTAAKKEIATLAGQVCADPKKLTAYWSKCTGSDNVKDIFDGNFETRWSTIETKNSNDLDNAKIIMSFAGDMHVSYVKIAFFDGDLAHQYFSLYTQKAKDSEWTLVLDGQQAARTETWQTFDLQVTGVHVLSIVGHGNDVGDFSKISEVEVYGC